MDGAVDGNQPHAIHSIKDVQKTAPAQGTDPPPEKDLAKLIKEGLALTALGLIVHVFSFSFQLGYLRAFGLPSDLVSLGVASVYTAGFWVVAALLLHFIVLVTPQGEGVLLTCLTVVALSAGFGSWFHTQVPYLWLAACVVWLIEYGVPYIQFWGEPPEAPPPPLADPVVVVAQTPKTKLNPWRWVLVHAHSFLALMIAYPLENGSRLCPKVPFLGLGAVVERAKHRLWLAEKFDKDLLGLVFGRLLGPRWLICFALYAPTLAYCLGGARATTDDTFLVAHKGAERWVVVKVLDGKAAVLQVKGDKNARLTGLVRFIELQDMEQGKVTRIGPLHGHSKTSAR